MIKIKGRKFWLRLFLFVIGLFVLSVLSLLVYFQINKDEIGKRILLRVNDMQPGALDFEEVNFHPFVSFPDMSVGLSNARYFEKPLHPLPADTAPIIELERLYISFNALKLLQGNISVSQILFTNGKVHLITYPDSTVNITQAIGITPESFSEEADASEETGSSVDLNLQGIALSNITLKHDNRLDSSVSDYQVRNLRASLKLNEDTIKCVLNANLMVNNIKVSDELTIREKPVRINAKLKMSRDFQQLNIAPSTIEFSKARFKTHGTIDLEKAGYIDLSVEGDDKDFSILNLVLAARSIELIEKGDVFFEGTIKGRLYSRLPVMDFTFGVRLMKIDIPGTDRAIRNLDLNGAFTSGYRKDYSDASVSIHKLTADLPEGALSARLNLKNLKHPAIDLDLKVKANVKGFEHLFELKDIRNLSGLLDLECQLKGKLDKDQKTFSKEKSQAQLNLDFLTFVFKDETQFHNISTKLNYKDENLLLEDLTAHTSLSQASLNGNLSYPLSFLKETFLSNLKDKPLINGLLTEQHEGVSQLGLGGELSLDCSEFEIVLDSTIVSDLTGNVGIQLDYFGTYDFVNGQMLSDSGRADLTFDQFYCSLDSINPVQVLSGELSLQDKSLFFTDFDARFGKSDFLINGNMADVDHFLKRSEDTFQGDLHIKCDLYDFVDFFNWDKRIGYAFPYEILDVDLKVKPVTSYKWLTDFMRAPRIEFQIDQLHAEIKDFLPPVEINNGFFLLTDQDSTVHLDFSKFSIGIAEGDLDAHVTINSPRHDPDQILIKTRMEAIKCEQAFEHWFTDSVPKAFRGTISGDLALDMVISLDDSLQFDAFDVSTKILEYQTDSNTFDLNGMDWSATDVAFNSDNVGESISFKSELEFNDVKANFLNLEEPAYDVSAHKGEFTILTDVSGLLQSEGMGRLVMSPFKDPASYELAYSTKEFEVGRLLELLNQDTIFQGILNLDLLIKVSGSSRQELLSTLDGHFNLEGKDLTFNGIDLDKIIERFKRSQRFTFADFGAVLLMGPAGLVVTKGSDYTSMLVVNQHTSSKIKHLSSYWNFENGLITLDDVAFSTEKNRMAAGGWLDVRQDTINLAMALLNDKGCCIYKQGIEGTLTDPDLAKFAAGRVLFAPVTNLAKSIGFSDCEVFYSGRVTPPKKSKKSDESD